MALMWSGDKLGYKRKKAVELFRSTMSGKMLDHDEWVQMTEILWQHLSDRLHEAQLDVIRCERFSSQVSDSVKESTLERCERMNRYHKAMRALNFIFKCFEIDWHTFANTVMDLVDGKATSGVPDVSEPPKSPQDGGSLSDDDL